MRLLVCVENICRVVYKDFYEFVSEVIHLDSYGELGGYLNSLSRELLTLDEGFNEDIDAVVLFRNISDEVVDFEVGVLSQEVFGVVGGLRSKLLGDWSLDLREVVVQNLGVESVWRLNEVHVFRVVCFKK